MPMWEQLINLAGVFIADKSNKKAVGTANQSLQKGLAAETDAVNRYIQDNYRNLGLELDQYGRIYADNAIGLTFIRGLLANPQKLTDAQRAELDESRRVTAENVRSGGFGGSARTSAAIMQKNEGDLTRGFLEDNRAAAMRAASPLATAANEAQMRTAGAIRDYGGRQGEAVLNLGRRTGDTYRAQGENTAGGQVASGKLWGSALGDVSGSIAADQRESRYADRMKQFERQLGLGDLG